MRSELMIESVKIDSTVYTIKTTDEPIIVEHRECMGCIDYQQSSIDLIKGMGLQQTKKTLLHEIVHGIMYERGLIDDRDLERVTDEMAKGFLNLLQDNPKLVKYLLN